MCILSNDTWWAAEAETPRKRVGALPSRPFFVAWLWNVGIVEGSLR